METAQKHSSATHGSAQVSQFALLQTPNDASVALIRATAIAILFASGVQQARTSLSGKFENLVYQRS